MRETLRPHFEAHFDVANPQSENCADNTAAICILLSLCTKKDFEGTIAFCDTEEWCNTTTSGIRYLCNDLKKQSYPDILPAEQEKLICLDMAANGSLIWTDHPDGLKQNGGVADILVKTPPQNAVLARLLNYPKAACIGLLPPEELKNGKTPKTWMRYHSLEDKFSYAEPTAMENLANQLHLCVKSRSKTSTKS